MGLNEKLYMPIVKYLTLTVEIGMSLFLKPLDYAARELVLDGMSWMVGNGELISIKKDRWMGIDKLEKPISNLPDEWSNKMVSALIDTESGQWKNEVISAIFMQKEAGIIKQMPRPMVMSEDQRVWRFTKQGWFTVRSAYHRAVEMYSPISGRRTSSSRMQNGWAKIWKIRAIPRVRLFLWRACTDALPVKQLLAKRKCSDDQICVLCGEEKETIDHLLLHCSQVQPIWYASSLRLDMQQQKAPNFRDFLWSSMETCPPQYISLLAYTVWEIWTKRNAVIFDWKTFGFEEVLRKATDRWREDDDSCEEGKLRGKSREVEAKWTKPPPGQLKLNTDVEIWPNEMIGLGFVLRNSEGNVVLVGKSEAALQGNSTILEGLAIRHALQTIGIYNLQANVIECDNQSMVNKINGKGEMDVYSCGIVQDIRRMMEARVCKECLYIPRKANEVAHHIAHGPNFIRINHNPGHVIASEASEALH